MRSGGEAPDRSVPGVEREQVALVAPGRAADGRHHDRVVVEPGEAAGGGLGGEGTGVVQGASPQRRQPYPTVDRPGQGAAVGGQRRTADDGGRRLEPGRHAETALCPGLRRQRRRPRRPLPLQIGAHGTLPGRVERQQVGARLEDVERALQRIETVSLHQVIDERGAQQVAGPPARPALVADEAHVGERRHGPLRRQRPQQRPGAGVVEPATQAALRLDPGGDPLEQPCRREHRRTLAHQPDTRQGRRSRWHAGIGELHQVRDLVAQHQFGQVAAVEADRARQREQWPERHVRSRQGHGEGVEDVVAPL